MRQTGGTVDGVLHQIADDPLFKISENAVLFLKQPEPGLFYVVGGPSGRFEGCRALPTAGPFTFRMDRHRLRTAERVDNILLRATF